jgi:hypothetical protein
MGLLTVEWLCRIAAPDVEDLVRRAANPHRAGCRRNTQSADLGAVDIRKLDTDA